MLARILDTGDFLSGLWKSLAMIGANEIGDKTFFIAAIMAMNSSRMLVFGGALAALTVMTILSAFIGWLVGETSTVFGGKNYTDFAASLLFFYFGYKLLRGAFKPEDADSELAQVEDELDGVKNKEMKDKSLAVSSFFRRLISTAVSPIVVRAFTLTFLAEWGDRSQISTITLAAQTNFLGVTIGGIIGHALCTGGAVVGGRVFASKISERTVSLVGGILFLVFGVQSFILASEIDKRLITAITGKSDDGS